MSKRVPFWRRYQELPVVELQKSNPVRFGLVVLVIVAIVVFFGFTKRIPFKHGYRLKGTFATAVNISPRSPVREAGVNVGQVTSVKRVGDTGVVTMEITKGGLPIHSDATLKIRARILLEGNWFIELQPGTPSAPTLSSGSTIPVTQTADPVQLDQVLDALNSDTRSDLQSLLAEYGSALTRKPTPAEDAIQNPAVRGLNAAQALKKSYFDSVPALKGGAIVGQATAGIEQNDLSKLVAGLDGVTSKLNVHEQQLGELITNFNTFLGELASQSQNIVEAVSLLPSTLQNAGRGFTELNKSSPSLRAWALDLVPGVEATPALVKAGTPWVEQVRASLASNELGGLAKGLQEASPSLAGLIVPQPAFFKETDEFSKCLSNVILPAGNVKLQDGANTSGVEDYKEFWYALAGLSGAGQSFDGNGPLSRFMLSTGTQTLLSQPANVVGSPTSGKKLKLLAHTANPPLGTHPAFPVTEPSYRPLVACDTQSVPDFNGPLSQGPADGSAE